MFNQFTEIFSVLELAFMVKEQAGKLGFRVEVNHLENPRVELEEHYYNAAHTKLLDLGLQPHALSDVLILDILRRVQQFSDRIRREVVLPKLRWDEKTADIKVCN